MPWSPPSLTLIWGAYFKPDADDEAKVVASTKMAKDAGLITMRSAVEKVRRIYGIEAVSEYLEQLEAESAERAETQAVDPSTPDTPEEPK